jgi:integrase
MDSVTERCCCSWRASASVPRRRSVAALTLDAFDWQAARLRVAGKGRREDWLPLPQDAGDAVLAYIEKARPRIRDEAVFLTMLGFRESD